jgi:hypothetical protein
MSTKRCKTCHQTLPLMAFAKDFKAKGGHRNECRKCARERSAAWRDARSARVAARRSPATPGTGSPRPGAAPADPTRGGGTGSVATVSRGLGSGIQMVWEVLPDEVGDLA